MQDSLIKGQQQDTGRYDNRTYTYHIPESLSIVYIGCFILHPTTPTRSDQAINFRSSCESMCPEFEIVERKNQNSIDPMELSKIGAVDIQKVVKAYRRSARGNRQPLLYDVRSTSALTGYIRGYVHHWYQRVILSKTDPFQPLEKVNHITFHYDRDGIEDHMRDAQPDFPQELSML